MQQVLFLPFTRYLRGHADKKYLAPDYCKYLTVPKYCWVERREERGGFSASLVFDKTPI